MTKHCEKCGRPLDKHTGLCPECDGDVLVSMLVEEEDIEEEDDEETAKKYGFIAVLVAILLIIVIVSVFTIGSSKGLIGGKKKEAERKAAYSAFINNNLFAQTGLFDTAHPGVGAGGLMSAAIIDVNKDSSSDMLVVHAENTNGNMEYKLSCYEYNARNMAQGRLDESGGAVNVELNSTVTAVSEKDYSAASADEHEPNAFVIYSVEGDEKNFIFTEHLTWNEGYGYDLHVYSIDAGVFTEEANLSADEIGGDGTVVVHSSKLPKTLQINDSNIKLSDFAMGMEIKTAYMDRGEALLYVKEGGDSDKEYNTYYSSAEEAIGAFFKVFNIKKESFVTLNEKNEPRYSLNYKTDKRTILTYSYYRDSANADQQDVYRIQDYSDVKSFISKENLKVAEEQAKKNGQSNNPQQTAALWGYGNVAKYGGDLYYWRYNTETYEENTAPFGAYEYNGGADNELVKRSADGTETVLLTTSGVGEIAITGNKIFYQKYTGDNDAYSINACDLDGGNIRYMTSGHIVGVVQNGAYVVCAPRISSNSFQTINSIRMETMEVVPTAYNSRFLFCNGDKIFLQPEQAEYREARNGKTTLACANANGSGNRNLYVTEEGLYNNDPSNYYERTASLIVNPTVLGDYIYYVYGSYLESDDSFVGGKLVRIKLDGSGFEVLNDNMKTDTYTVNNAGEQVTADTSATMQNFVYKDGGVYRFNPASATLEELISVADYAAFSSASVNESTADGERRISVKFAEETDGKLYFAVEEGAFSAEDGEYRYVSCALFEKDLSSGNVQMLYASQANTASEE